MIIEVYRNDGSLIGDPITETMLSDDALIVRGRAEMNANAHALIHHDLSVIYQDGFRLGQLVDVIDPASVEPYKAKITGIQIRFQNGLIETNLSLEQPDVRA